MNKSLSIGSLAILLGALCASTTGTAQALAPEGATPLAMGTIRMLGGGISLLLLGLFTRNLPKREGWPLVRTVLCALGLVGFQLCFFVAIKSIGVAVGTVVAVGSSPIAVGLFGWLALGEKPSHIWYTATAIAVAGLTALTFSGGSTEGMNFDLIGFALAVLAGSSYAVFLVGIKPLLKVHDSAHIMTVVFLIGGLAMTPILFNQSLAWVPTVHGVLVILDLGILTTAVAFTLILYGMKTTPVAVTSTLGLAEPLGAALLGIFLLNEPVTVPALLGMGLIFCSMVLLVLQKPDSAA